MFNKWFLVFVLITVLFNISCKKNPTTSINKTPMASFTISPTTGTTATMFNFDASGSTDNQDETTVLQVRWDWEDDGTYDTNFSTIKTETHQFSIGGTHTVKLEVRDSNGLTNTVTKEVIITIESVTDIDGNVYSTINIGSQLWMAENLKTTHYQNGNAIPNILSNSEWSNLSTDAYCSYYNNDYNMDMYGLLYNWYTVDDIGGLAPVGWHIPTDEEWTILINYLGGYSVAGGKMKETGYNHWNNPNYGATNESGFSVVPGGSRDYSDGTFYDGRNDAIFWTFTANNSSSAWYVRLTYLNRTVIRLYQNKSTGLSIRCIKD